jgi:hypothetical protein
MDTSVDVTAVIVPDMSYLVIERNGKFNAIISGTELLALLDDHCINDFFIDALDQ